jgi:hypothetical protein
MIVRHGNYSINWWPVFNKEIFGNMLGRKEAEWLVKVTADAQFYFLASCSDLGWPQIEKWRDYDGKNSWSIVQSV